MPDLGTKHTCFKCGTKFYDLRKNPVLCPKCGADQKDAPPQPTSPVVLHAVRRAKRDEFADPDVFDRNREEEDVATSEPRTRRPSASTTTRSSRSARPRRSRGADESDDES